MAKHDWVHPCPQQTRFSTPWSFSVRLAHQRKALRCKSGSYDDGAFRGRTQRHTVNPCLKCNPRCFSCGGRCSFGPWVVLNQWASHPCTCINLQVYKSPFEDDCNRSMSSESVGGSRPTTSSSARSLGTSRPMTGGKPEDFSLSKKKSGQPTMSQRRHTGLLQASGRDSAFSVCATPTRCMPTLTSTP